MVAENVELKLGIVFLIVTIRRHFQRLLAFRFLRRLLVYLKEKLSLDVLGRVFDGVRF